MAAESPIVGILDRESGHERRRRKPLPAETRPHPFRHAANEKTQELSDSGKDDRPAA